MPLSVLIVLISFAVLGVAWLVKKQRILHIALMGSVMLFDLLFPVWLYATHDWLKRLIDQGELLSFAIWAHVFLILTLYALYVLQILAGRKLLGGQATARPEHRLQARGILIIRTLVFISGAMLIAPE